MTYEEKWALVRPFYEKAYAKAFGERVFKFVKAPTETQLEDLYQNMLKVQKTMGMFYDQNPILEKRLSALRGQVPDTGQK